MSLDVYKSDPVTVKRDQIVVHKSKGIGMVDPKVQWYCNAHQIQRHLLPPINTCMVRPT